VLWLLGVPSRRAPTVTEEEVRFAIAEGTAAGVIQEKEEEMIHGVLGLADRPVAAIMTPRPDIYWIDLDDDAATIVREIADCPYSRLVVVRGGDLGHPLGVVQVRDFVDDLLAERGLQVEKHLREPLYVPESIRIMRMLDMFRAVPLHAAFVIDEYGDLLGLVTLTDVMGAIAGELPEEHEPISQEVVRRPDGSWLVDGRASIEDVREKLSLRGVEGEFHTAAGLALDRLARIPVEGERFDVEGWTVEIIDMDGKRIDKLLFIPLPRAAAEQDPTLDS
jgi:putative hemolysin